MTPCMRCAVRPRPSAFRVSFTYEDIEIELDLCEEHLAFFDRDMQAWARLGREVNPTPPRPEPPAPKPKNVHVPFPITYGGVVDKDDTMPEPCPPWERATVRSAPPASPAYDPQLGLDYTAAVLMNNRGYKEKNGVSDGPSESKVQAE